MDMTMFLNYFAQALPGIAIFWGITYYVLIKRNKLEVRTSVATAYFLAPAVILGFVGWGALQNSYSAGIQLLVPLVLSVISCSLLYYQESNYQASKKFGQPPATSE